MTGAAGPPPELLGGLETIAVVAVAVIAVPMLLVAFLYLHSRHRMYTRGLRGTAVVVEVRPTRLFEQHSVVEKPTVRVVVATAAVPRGVLTDQKLPAGEYHPGQVVPVVQDPKRPDRLYVDRPDLEQPASVVYAPLVVLCLVPVGVVITLTQQAGG